MLLWWWPTESVEQGQGLE